MYGTCVGDIAHGRRDNRASNDGHDQQRRPEFGVNTEIFHAESEDSWEHDGIKEAQQHNGPNGGRSRSRDSRQSTQERAGCEESQQPGRSDSFHHCRPSKAANHESDQVPFQKIGGHFFGRVGQGVLGKANHKAGHADLRAHIKKLGDDAFNQMLVSPNIPALPRSVLRLK